MGWDARESEKTKEKLASLLTLVRHDWHLSNMRCFHVCACALIKQSICQTWLCLSWKQRMQSSSPNPELYYKLYQIINSIGLPVFFVVGEADAAAADDFFSLLFVCLFVHCGCYFPLFSEELRASPKIKPKIQSIIHYMLCGCIEWKTASKMAYISSLGPIKSNAQLSMKAKVVKFIMFVYSCLWARLGFVARTFFVHLQLAELEFMGNEQSSRKVAFISFHWVFSALWNHLEKTQWHTHRGKERRIHFALTQITRIIQSTTLIYSWALFVQLIAFMLHTVLVSKITTILELFLAAFE